ncbi:FtsB family cell division protein [Sphingosinicella microcystinivorans]|uniref:FtsB family cell division protein n=1 Tax=Sphingosinicella microcystinivorans TaxID=335406 RepID=UPI0022F3F2FE|nr:septum formation initiator family protein [Sphingosinicella microcystinivorans]WBX83327.1 septum formation initiator family protein [Sphingosinicella microcystinivorans]
MSEPVRLVSYIRSAWLPALCIGLVAFFGWHAVAGDTGILALGGYKAEQTRLAREAEAVAKRKADLERKVALLDPAKVDPDLADELVRENLGLVREDEFVIRLDK